MAPYDEGLVVQAEDAILATYAEAGREPDAARGAVWIARMVYDYCAGLSWEASERKHLRELRAELGLTNTAQPISLPRLIMRGQMFEQADGQPWTAIECSDFNLFARYQAGEQIDPILAQRQDLGFNLLRVWTLYDLPGIGTLLEPDYSQIPAFLERCAAYGLYVEFTAYTSTERIDHWDRLVAAVQGCTNVLLELVNEGDLPVNAIDFSRYARPPGVLVSHGSGGSEAAPMLPAWDYQTFHTNGAFEEQRKIGHNAMEIWNGPTLTNETSRYPDVGMWVGASPERQWGLAYDAAAGAALLCAGSCFHSVAGKTSVLFDSATQAVARAWTSGARSVDLSAQHAPYVHRSDLESADLLRVYQRGPALVTIRK